MSGSYHPTVGRKHRFRGVHLFCCLLSSFLSLDVPVRAGNQWPNLGADGPCFQGHRQRTRGSPAEGH